MEYLSLIATVTAIHLLAVITPGPDFIMAVRNSLVYSRRTGIWTAVGFGLGIAVHVFYCLAGLALIISKSILIFNIIKYLGAGYLAYIGIRSILSKKANLETTAERQEDISRWKAIKIGFLTNVLNPKATLFFLSLFTLVISPTTPLSIMITLGSIMIINTILWFSLVAVLMTQTRIRSLFDRFQGVFNKTLGGLLIALGIKVALTHR